MGYQYGGFQGGGYQTSGATAPAPEPQVIPSGGHPYMARPQSKTAEQVRQERIAQGILPPDPVEPIEVKQEARVYVDGPLPLLTDVLESEKASRKALVRKQLIELQEEEAAVVELMVLLM
jgi:hypothetical protein